MGTRIRKPDDLQWSAQKIRRRKPARMLFVLSGLLFVLAVVTFMLIYNEGNMAADNAKKLLAQYTTSSSETNLSPTSAQAPELYGGYHVIGKLSIERTGQEYAIIDQTTASALKVSCCYYKGPMPGEKGNLVITGHDYANGAIFGRLSELKTGDTVSICSPKGEYTYSVYKLEVIKPDENQKLDAYKGEMALTLMTCTSNGNGRLLVFCELISKK